MAPQFEFFGHIFIRTDQVTQSYVTSKVADIMLAVSPIAQQMLLLYVLLWGFAAYRGLINEYIMDGVFRIVKVILVISIATQVGLYSDIIANNLQELPDYLASLFGGGSLTGSSVTTLDKILSDGLFTGKVFWEQASLNPLDMDIGPMIMAVFTWITVVISTGYAAFLIVLSKIALAVLISLGPLFIIMLMFDATKKFFESWVGQIVTFSLISALAIGVITLVFSMLGEVAAATAAKAAGPSTPDKFDMGVGILTIISMILISMISFLILIQVPAIASGLGGGLALSTLGAAGAMMSKAKGAVGAANRRTTDRERRDPTTWTGAARERGRQRVAAAWAIRKAPGDNSIQRTT